MLFRKAHGEGLRPRLLKTPTGCRCLRTKVTGDKDGWEPGEHPQTPHSTWLHPTSNIVFVTLHSTGLHPLQYDLYPPHSTWPPPPTGHGWPLPSINMASTPTLNLAIIPTLTKCDLRCYYHRGLYHFILNTAPIPSNSHHLHPLPHLDLNPASTPFTQRDSAPSPSSRPLSPLTQRGSSLSHSTRLPSLHTQPALQASDVNGSIASVPHHVFAFVSVSFFVLFHANLPGMLLCLLSRSPRLSSRPGYRAPSRKPC